MVQRRTSSVWLLPAFIVGCASAPPPKIIDTAPLIHESKLLPKSAARQILASEFGPEWADQPYATYDQGCCYGVKPIRYDQIANVVRFTDGRLTVTTKETGTAFFASGPNRGRPPTRVYSEEDMKVIIVAILAMGGMQ